MKIENVQTVFSHDPQSDKTRIKAVIVADYFVNRLKQAVKTGPAEKI